MLTKIKHNIINIDKHIFIRNFLFVLAVTVVYSLSVNIPLIKMNYPEKYFILALFNIMAYALLTYQVLLQGRENGGAGQNCSEEISEARA